MTVAPGYRDRLKTEIVRISREILATEGLDGLQARKIATASDCSVGTIYNLFGSLDIVVITANAETLAELHMALMQSQSQGVDLAGHLEALALAYLQFAIERRTEWRAIFEHRLTTKTTVPEWYRESQAQLFAIVEEILEPEIDTVQGRQEAARAMFSAVHGVISLALDQKLGEFDQEATQRQVRFIVKSVARGLSDVD